MKTSDRVLLTRVAVVLLLAWFTGDVVLGTAVKSIRRDTERIAADRARSNANRQRMGSSFNSTPPSDPDGFVAVISSTIVPLRWTGAAGLLLFVTFGPIGKWLHELRLPYARNRRALFGVIMLTVSVSLLTVAQVIASYNSTTGTENRQFTASELERDRQERTLVNPPSHLDPNQRPTGNLRSITFGADRSERVSVTKVRESVRGTVDSMRVVAGVIGALGLIYVAIAAMSPSVADANTESLADSGNDVDSADLGE